MLPVSYQLFKDPKCQLFFEYLGLLVFSYYTVKTALRLFNNLGTFFLGIGAVNFKKYGSWAVVTGCTDGIGKAYAEKLAKMKMNVVLVSRSLDKLQAQADELTKKYSIQTKVIAVDFTEQKKIYVEVRRQLEGLDIGLLVNNVGMGYKYPEYFAEIEDLDNTVDNLITCNITSVTKMTAIVLPGMVKRGGGVVINNASASGRIPTPLLTVYSATKAYVDFFSRGLKLEYQSKGIIVQSLCPYFVATKLAGIRKNFMAPNPDEYVASSIKTVGSQPITNGCLIHNIQGFVMENVLPRSFLDNMTINQLKATSKKAKAKLAKQKETPKDK